MVIILRAIPVNLIGLLQPLPSQSFRLRQCQKTPAFQESRFKYAVETLDKWILPKASRINIVSTNSMVQEPILHLVSHKLTTVVSSHAIRCSSNGEQRLRRTGDVKSGQRTPA